MFFYKIYARSFQAVVALLNYFLGYRTPETLTGTGCVAKLPKRLREDGVKHPLVVVGPHIHGSGLDKPLLNALEENGLPYTVFTGVGANPTSDMVEAGLNAYTADECDAVIAFGGGSPMDAAKAVAARVACPKKSIAHLQGLLKVTGKAPRLYAIPTTAGTGSETTIAAVITDTGSGRKAAIMDPKLMPALAVLDPAFTLTLPPFTTAITGMDALCHAVEAYTNHTYNTRIENRMAKDAVKLIFENLPAAVQNGADYDARQNMQLAAFYAGRAFTRGCVGYVHALGHTTSALYNTSHGLAMAVLLPKVMRGFGDNAHRRLAELARYAGMPEGTDAEMAEAFIARIEKMNTEMGIPTYIENLREEDFPRILDWAQKEANPLYPVPEIWGRDMMEAVLRDTLAE